MESKCPICGAPMENGKCGYCNYEAPIQQAPPTTGNAQNQQGPVIINQVNVQPNNGRTLYRRAVSPKNKGVALVLCILFGYFGAHKFYVGKSGIGVNTDDVVHTARSSSAHFPVFQCMLSAA